MLARDINHAFYANFSARIILILRLRSLPSLLLQYNSLKDMPDKKLNTSSDTAFTAGKPNTQSTGKATVTKKTLECQLLTSSALTSLLNFIKPRTALPRRGDDYRYHLSMYMSKNAIYRYAMYRYVTFYVLYIVALYRYAMY
jgi:hypothetical protein